MKHFKSAKQTEDEFDFKNPDYPAIFQARAERLEWLRANPAELPALKAYYKENIADFITDWGLTYDPRGIEKGRPAFIPLILMPKQREWIEFVLTCWHNGDDSVSAKSRDCGLSWLAVSLACSLAGFYEGMSIGFGSRKESYLDDGASPKSLFWKARTFLNNLPVEFRGGWIENKHSSHMKISFPATKSFMGAEAGRSIGRGDRTALYFVDESAALENPLSVDSALSATTNCRVDISTPAGSDNPFAQKYMSGELPAFTFHWRDDPRKDDAWYAMMKQKLDPITLAQEVDLDFNASKTGILIPSEWVRAAVDAHKKISYWDTSGIRFGAFDVADGGKDKCAFISRKATVIDFAEEWTGVGSDIFGSTVKVFGICQDLGLREFKYDADGLGAGVKGDARIINIARAEAFAKEQGHNPDTWTTEQKAEAERATNIKATPFRGSGKLIDEDRKVEGFDDRLNKDFFQNAKAQAWWYLRAMFQRTYRAVTEGEVYPVEDMISISSEIPNVSRLTMELSQPTFQQNLTGKIVVDKAPDGVKSPNLGDGVMISLAPEPLPVYGFFSRRTS